MKQKRLLIIGCATVVLETVLALQSYAISRRDPRRKTWKSDGFCDENAPNSNKITASTNSMCGAVAKLTQWADRVIMVMLKSIFYKKEHKNIKGTKELQFSATAFCKQTNKHKYI